MLAYIKGCLQVDGDGFDDTNAFLPGALDFLSPH